VLCVMDEVLLQIRINYVDAKTGGGLRKTQWECHVVCLVKYVNCYQFTLLYFCRTDVCWLFLRFFSMDLLRLLQHELLSF